MGPQWLAPLQSQSPKKQGGDGMAFSALASEVTWHHFVAITKAGPDSSGVHMCVCVSVSQTPSPNGTNIKEFEDIS